MSEEQYYEEIVNVPIDNKKNVTHIAQCRYVSVVQVLYVY